MDLAYLVIYPAKTEVLLSLDKNTCQLQIQLKFRMCIGKVETMIWERIVKITMIDTQLVPVWFQQLSTISVTADYSS